MEKNIKTKSSISHFFKSRFRKVRGVLELSGPQLSKTALTFSLEVEQVSGIPAGITWISEYLDFLYPYLYLDFQNAGIRYDKVSDQDTCTGIRHMSFSYQDTCTWVDTCPFRYQNNL